MKYLVTYDISDDKIRSNLSKFLLKYGVRVQFSCFELECNEKELKEITSFIESIIDIETDSVFLFPISKNMEKSIIELGSSRNIDYEVI
jgi:CRISPR-associated protein Cas2